MIFETIPSPRTVQYRTRVSKNAVFGLNFLPGFWTWQILWIVPILTGFGPHPRGPKRGQGQLADLDALAQYHHSCQESYINSGSFLMKTFHFVSASPP